MVVTADVETVYDKARALELRLRTIEYNDAIDGYRRRNETRSSISCTTYARAIIDYYATSMAVMLRSVGIPARVVSGYAEGSYIQEGGVSRVRGITIVERDGAYVVEVFFPITAGSSLSRPRAKRN